MENTRTNCKKKSSKKKNYEELGNELGQYRIQCDGISS
jgi:hypothetical protein